jgi:threonyl-tRNA synthetase
MLSADSASAVASIQVKLPDGSVRTFPKGSTAFDVANSISPRLAAASIVAKVKPLNVSKSEATSGGPGEAPPAEAEMYSAAAAAGEHLVDLHAPIKEDAETKLGHGPATDAGFFYDFYRPTPFTPDDLKAIEAKMAEVVARDEKFVHEFEGRDEAVSSFKGSGDFMKLHFVERFTKPGEMISLYRNGHFIDFCRGPHVPSTGRVRAFKVLSLAGAYWLGDEKNPQLQRVYGTAFFSQKEMDAHFERLEEMAKRDHRLLGKQLDLFSIQEVAGAGLIFWHPKGGIVRKTMEDWMREECIRRGYDLVYTPHVMRRELWRISGHEGHYAQNMYTPMELDDAEYRLKPMNCPGHILIYKNSPKSYRDLPVRYAELGNVYRYERSGTMHGLLRVRGFTQDDAHIFCTPEQVEDEMAGCVDFAEAVLRTFGFKEFKVELSTWDPKHSDSYDGTPEQWQQATQALENVLKRKGIPYRTFLGEGAFYGPKIDIKLVDVLGRLWQLSTVQFDFNLPKRFELEYVGEDGERHQPFMVHRALFGSVERFFGVLIEHYAGAFPLWLAPVQIGLVPISERHHEYAEKVQQQLQKHGFRVELDARNEKMNAKIRDFTMQKVPYVLVMGDKEVEALTVSVRARGGNNSVSLPFDEFLTRIEGLTTSQSTEL